MAVVNNNIKCALRHYKLEVLFYNRYKQIRNCSNYSLLKSHSESHVYPVRRTYLPTNTWKLNSKTIYTSHVTLQKVVPFNLSDIGEGIREVTVKEWFVNVGDTVAQFDKICEVQSDKASVTITSRYDGVIKKLYHEIDSIALVGEPLIDIEVASDPQIAEEVKSKSKFDDDDSSSSDEEHPVHKSSDSIYKTLATPAVRRIAAENQLKLTKIVGTGKKGRVLKEDIIAYLAKVDAPTSPPVRTQAVQTKPPSDKPQLIQGYMKAMAKTMTASLKIPHFVYSDEVIMTELVKLCLRLKSAPETKGIKITYMPFFIKATSKALSHFPIINSSLDDKCEYITTKSSHNIGVAMDTANGLVVPNVKNVQDLNIYQIAIEMSRLQKLGQTGGFSLPDLTGGTITFSNIGAVGGTYCKPVILSPEIAIAAIGKVQVVPRYAGDEIVKTHVSHVSWAADHRVVDGATMARFSNVWKRYIENPELLMLNI